MTNRDAHNREPVRASGRGCNNGGNNENTKARITIHIDRDVISYFKDWAAETTKGYQTLINDALREYTGLETPPHVIADLAERVRRLEERLLRTPST